jgi:hypothetical protein
MARPSCLAALRLASVVLAPHCTLATTPYMANLYWAGACWSGFGEIKGV